MKSAKASLLPLLLVLPATSALAHPGHAADGGLAAGLLHPCTGLDHLLALLAVGLWAAHLGGRARAWVPATFVGTMALAAVLGAAMGTIPGMDQAIAATVFLLGLLVATGARASLGTGVALAAGFAAFHGFAHGAEMPATAGGLAYGAGFVTATSLVLALGVLLGSLAATVRWPVARGAGWTIAAAGLALLAA